MTSTQALELGEKLMKFGYKEIGKVGSGVFEKIIEKQTYRFGIDKNSLIGAHRPNMPHIHVEILDEFRNVIVNNHTPFIELV